MGRTCGRKLSPRSFFLLLKLRLQPIPSPLFGLASWPPLGACPIIAATWGSPTAPAGSRKQQD